MIAKGLNWGGLKKCCPLKENKEEEKLKYKESQRGKVGKERVKERERERERETDSQTDRRKIR